MNRLGMEETGSRDDLSSRFFESEWVAREVEAMAAAWGQGEHVTAAQVLERHPEADTEDAVRLIYEEICLRREAGLDAETSETIRRYPQWAEELQALLDCDRLLRPSGLEVNALELGETLGPFRLLSELGRGASGRTFLAADATLADRPVVVKVMPDDQDEHLALARLRHTHIVPLFSELALPERGLRALCMPYLGGASLARILDDLAAIPPERRTGKVLVEIIDRHAAPSPDSPPADSPFRRGLEQAAYVQAVCWIAACLADALQYAHARGMVHMDLKPSNVLVTIDGQPMLLDFHLARGPIRSGDRVIDRLGGTPGWMSPEQEAALSAAGEGLPVPTAVDGRTDIFALGLILLEALAPPGTSCRGRDARAALRGQPGVSVGLADIVLKCLAPDPRDRYPDAARLAEDLRRHLNDQPLRGVGNRSAFELWGKWRRRRPGVLAWGIAGASLLLAGVVALGVGAVVYGQRIDRIRADLDDGRIARAEGRYDEAVRALKQGLELARTTPATRDLTRALSEELVQAQRDRMAEALRDLADRIRFRYGVELPANQDAQALLQSCEAILARKDRLIAVLDADTESGQRIRTDLLEVAAVAADLIVHLAPPNALDSARHDALRLLDEADAAFGPSLSLGLRRDQLALALGRTGADNVGTRTPQSAWEHYDLGRYLLRSGRIDEASREFLLALDARPQDFWPNFYQGLCAFRLRRFDEAVAAFRVCIALAPQAAVCYYNRALAYEALGHVDEAHRDDTRAGELDPDLAAAWLNRGILAYRRNRPRDAVADFEHALSGQPDRETLGRLHYNLALAQRASGDRISARKHAEEAVRLGRPEAAALLDPPRGP